MKISMVMRELHEAYKKGNPSLGCMSRASILYNIMRSQGLNPERKLFSFKDNKGNRVVHSHCIIILNGLVYDSNIEEFKNPIEFDKYKEMKKREYPELNLIWKDWSA